MAPVAIQIWGFTHRTDLLDPPAPLLARLAESGYAGIESHPLPGLDGAALAGCGLSCAGVHLATGRLADDIDGVVADCRRLGARQVVTSGPRSWHQRGLDDWQETVRVLGRAGRHLADAGIRLLYHNHEFEFSPLPDGRLPFDLLVAGCTPGVCDLCLDAGWVWFAGGDPVALLREHASRIRSLHLRDFAGRTAVALGEGRLPLADLLRAAPAGLDWLVVEQDPVSADPLADARLSLDWLRRRS